MNRVVIFFVQKNGENEKPSRMTVNHTDKTESEKYVLRMRSGNPERRKIMTILPAAVPVPGLRRLFLRNYYR